MTKEKLEYLSDQVRHGIPIDFLEAIMVVEYQEGLRTKREMPLYNKLLNWWKEK